LWLYQLQLEQSPGHSEWKEMRAVIISVVVKSDPHEIKPALEAGLRQERA
jgi:hypothetical protein